MLGPSFNDELVLTSGEQRKRFIDSGINLDKTLWQEEEGGQWLERGVRWRVMWAYIGVVRNRRQEVVGDQWQRACRPCFKRLDAKGGDHNLSNCLCISSVIVKLYTNCSVGSEGGTMLLEDQRKLPGRGHWNRCLKMNRSLAVKEGEYGHSRQRKQNVLRPGAVVWIYVSPPPQQICMLNPPKVMVLGDGGFGRCLSHEGGALVNGISVLIKEAPERSLAPSTMWGPYRKSQQSAVQKRALTRPCWCPDLVLPTSRLWEINVCCLQATQSGYFVTAARMEKIPGNIKEHGVFRRHEILMCG